jgi:hypothetical protein
MAEAASFVNLEIFLHWFLSLLSAIIIAHCVVRVLLAWSFVSRIVALAAEALISETSAAVRLCLVSSLTITERPSSCLMLVISPYSMVFMSLIFS